MLHETLKRMDKFADIVLLQAGAAVTRTDTRALQPIPIEIEFHKFPLSNVDVEIKIVAGKDFPPPPNGNVNNPDLTSLPDNGIRIYWPSILNDTDIYFTHGEIREEYERRWFEVRSELAAVRIKLKASEDDVTLLNEIESLNVRETFISEESYELNQDCYAPRALYPNELERIKQALILLEFELDTDILVDYYIPTTFSGTSSELLWLLILFKHKCPFEIYKYMDQSGRSFKRINELMQLSGLRPYNSLDELHWFSNDPHLEKTMRVLRLNTEAFNNIQHNRHINQKPTDPEP